MEKRADHKVIVIGAGIGGLSAAIRLGAAGLSVTVIEAQSGPGGKMRSLPSAAGPVDAGPTVLTLRSVFDALFSAAGERLEDHLQLIAQPILARHWWLDGSSLDLFADPEASSAAIARFAGPKAEAQFRRFNALSAKLYTAFDAPMMQAARPGLGAIAWNALRAPGAWPALQPGLSLGHYLARAFDDPRLQQLFGRYATYVGGVPQLSPAVLALIWQAEARGVWAVEGGMHRLAEALAGLAERQGVALEYGRSVRRIERQSGRVKGVVLSDGRTLACDAVVFNGDPAGLLAGLLGNGPQQALPPSAAHPRSLSAWVWAFAATPTGPELVHHNVFFASDPGREFGPIGRGEMPDEATLYVCAQDRNHGTPCGPERFEIIMNAPASTSQARKEIEQCRARTFPQLARFGLNFDQPPPDTALTTPAGFAALHPGSQGAIYGRSPHGTLASFQRPGARTRLPGLYLAGGGAHPGAGVPMAALSGKHAAEAILSDLTSVSRSRQMAMPGGMSMASRTTGRAPSR
ncbi:MAG: phytoene desaturase [Rhodobacteraceae bacterium]|nr:phytoene desaturase [Paracoccaceae bacterium]